MTLTSDEDHSSVRVHQKKKITRLTFSGMTCFFICAVLWILSNTARMSKHIHDDHSSYWVSVETSKLMEWYNDVDVCVLSSPAAATPLSYTIPSLQHHDSGRSNSTSHHNSLRMKPQLQKNILLNLEANWSKKCTLSYPPVEGEVDREGSSRNVPLFCHISNCNMPLAVSQFHRKQLNSEKVKHVPRGSLMHHLTVMAESERPLVFIGDSVTKQSVEALFCEVTKLDVSSQLIGNLSTAEHVRVIFGSQNHSLSVFYIPFNGIKVSEEALLSYNHSKHHAHTHHRTSLSDLKLRVDQIQISFSGAITLVVSVGSSYYSRMKFRDDIANILDWLNMISESSGTSSPNRVFFRENAAQHWNASAHGYQTARSLADKDKEGHGGGQAACTPLGDAQSSLDWRNREVHAYLHRMRLRGVQVVPFRDITAPLFNMHINAPQDNATRPFFADCTKFCYFPQLWQALWSSLIID